MRLRSILIGISFASGGIIGIYMYYRWKQQKCKGNKKPEYHVVVKIPNSVLPYIFGKYGCAIETLQEKCSTRIKFNSPELSANETTCEIYGNPEKVQLAEAIVKSIVKMFVHEVGAGINIQEIINNDDITKSALSAEEREIFNDILHLLTLNNLETEPKIVPDLQYDVVQNISYYRDRTQKLVAVGGDNLIPVYVSSVATPEQFWVQATRTKEHAELDVMTQELSDYFHYYPERNYPPAYETVKLGNLYAVFLEENNNWYRVEVYHVDTKNEENPLNSTIDLYFLDYGFSLFKTLNDLRILPISFLELYFQAIECCLANTKPIENVWTEDSIIHFENLTHSAQWYTLQARIEYTIENEHVIGPIPCVTLIDPNNDDLNVNDEMVATGLARYSS